MSIRWDYECGNKGQWSWSCDLPNGWQAVVMDISHVDNDIGPTYYYVSAITKDGGLEMLDKDNNLVPFGTLTDAKHHALLFAAGQAIPLGMLGITKDTVINPYFDSDCA